MKFSTALSILSIFVISLPLKANAQVFNSDTLSTLKICQAIANMQDANLDNYELNIKHSSLSILTLEESLLGKK